MFIAISTGVKSECAQGAVIPKGGGPSLVQAGQDIST